MPFITPLVIQSLRRTKYRRLMRPLLWKSLDGTAVEVPSGFKTDYASIPKFLRSYIDQDSGKMRDAAVIHDYMYAVALFSREQCDDYFKEAMRDLGMRRGKAWVAWAAVRMFGSSSYKKQL